MNRGKLPKRRIKKGRREGIEKRRGQALGELCYRERAVAKPEKTASKTWRSESVKVESDMSNMEARVSKKRAEAMPLLETKSRKKGGAVLIVPRGVSTKRGEYRVGKWLSDGRSVHGGLRKGGGGKDKKGGAGVVKALVLEFIG